MNFQSKSAASRTRALAALTETIDRVLIYVGETILFWYEIVNYAAPTMCLGAVLILLARGAQ